jgi:hypothetical protein
LSRNAKEILTSVYPEMGDFWELRKLHALS